MVFNGFSEIGCNHQADEKPAAGGGCGLSRRMLLELKFNSDVSFIEAQRRSNSAIGASPSLRPVSVDRVCVVLLALLNKRSMRSLVRAAGCIPEMPIQRLTRLFKLR